MQDSSTDMSEEQKKKRKFDEEEAEASKKQKSETQDLVVESRGKEEKKETPTKLIPDKECEFEEDQHLTEKGKLQMEFAGLECVVCREVPAEVLTGSNCETVHIHCRICVDKIERHGLSRRCAVCRTLGIFEKNEVLTEQRGRIECRCCFHDRRIDDERPGCQKLVPLSDWISHVQRCDYAIFECGGCHDGFYSGDIKQHQTQCPEMLTKCEKCGSSVIRRGLVGHNEANCTKRVTKAPCCGKETTADQVSAHLGECPEMLIACTFGCPMEIKRGAMEEHLRFDEANMKTHYNTCRHLLKYNEDLVKHQEARIENLRKLGEQYLSQTPFQFAAPPVAEVDGEEVRRIEATTFSIADSKAMHDALVRVGLSSDEPWDRNGGSYMAAIEFGAKMAKFYVMTADEIAKIWLTYWRTFPTDQRPRINCIDLKRLTPTIQRTWRGRGSRSDAVGVLQDALREQVLALNQPINLTQRRVAAPAPSPAAAVAPPAAFVFPDYSPRDANARFYFGRDPRIYQPIPNSSPSQGTDDAVDFLGH